MLPVLLIDFGSTYTKLTAVDVSSASLLGTASAFTTVTSDIAEGLEHALEDLSRKTGSLPPFAKQFACSSAAGGLRMIVSGLVPELTAEAGRMAALGAGAKVSGLYSYQLTDEDAAEIIAAEPDIFLLTGGTDGGNRDIIVNNARTMAQRTPHFPIIYCGNRTAAAECANIFDSSNFYRCENVMPRFNQLNIAPVQSIIREIFLSKIVRAKGLTRVSGLLSGILMPTPSAMLKAMELLSNGIGQNSGLGELAAIDLGGATTDVYSIAAGNPRLDNVVLKNLPEPFSKRTVEGDIGIRYGAKGIVDVVGLDRLSALSSLPVKTVQAYVDHVTACPNTLPTAPEERALDYALASAAVETAMTRHAGKVEQFFTPMGVAYAQTGKDLTSVKTLIMTGGAIIHAANTADIAGHALYSELQPASLRPKNVSVLKDKEYILSAMGLLSEEYPDIALTIMKKELEPCQILTDYDNITN